VTTVLGLLLANGLLGAIDTLWYHEWRAQLARRGGPLRTELALHAGRDAIYTVIYATLGWLAWHGAFAVLLTVLLAGEILLTLADFVTEDRLRPAIGGMAAGERVLHTAMAIVYGAMLASLVPLLDSWWGDESALATHSQPPPAWMAAAASVLAAGIAVSGARDALATWDLRPCPPLAGGLTIEAGRLLGPLSTGGPLVAELENERQPELVDYRTIELVVRFAKVLVVVVYAVVIVTFVMLTLGFFLHLLGASADAPFAEWVYRNTDRAMQPFRGMFPVEEIDGRSVFDGSLLFGAAVYAFVAMGLHALVAYLTGLARRYQRAGAAAAGLPGAPRTAATTSSLPATGQPPAAGEHQTGVNAAGPAQTANGPRPHQAL
jgi:uncharacterized protein YggT (Ycf19 family)